MPMDTITLRVPEAYVNGIDRLVADNMYPSRSEAIRSAMRDLLKRELWQKGRGEDQGSSRNQNFDNIF